MKILMVSMFINHFFNWVLQLEKSGHEVYWIEVTGANTYVKNRFCSPDYWVEI